jgi:hypothetical protein
VIKSRRIKQEEYVARMGNRRISYRVLVGRPKGKRPLGRHGSRFEDTIQMILLELGFGVMDWIYVAQNKDSWWDLFNVVVVVVVVVAVVVVLVVAGIIPSSKIDPFHFTKKISQ